jgi:hypothetical protein
MWMPPISARAPARWGPDGNRGADIPKTLPDNPPGPEFYEQQAKAAKAK